MSATGALLRPARDRDPARPLLTYYDDATGERTELSAVTLDNWVAKTANLLRDDLAVAPGDRVAVLLPAHWQTVAVLLAAWELGAVVTADPDGAAAAFVDAPRLPLASGADEVVALSLAPLGRGLDAPLPGVVDYAVDVRAHGDRFAPGRPVPDSAPALDTGPAELSVADVLDRARGRAEALGVGDGDRVLSTLGWDGPDDWFDGLLALLAAGASLVQCVNPPAAEALAHRAATERVTATIGTSLPGLPLLCR
jgi:uncharacterized protein (TIGR03089 family)